MAKKINLFLVIFISLLFAGIVSAAFPFIQSNVNGYNIKIPVIGTLKQNQDFLFNFHVYNSSNGVPIDNSSTDCVMHLYDPTGNQIMQENVPHSDEPTVDNEWEITILGGNLSSIGSYAYVVQCNSTSLGGFEGVGVEVTSTGIALTTASSVVYASMFFLLMAFFGVTLFGISKLPGMNQKDEEGKILSVSYLKYLRSVLWFFEWMFVLGIMFLASNLGSAYLGESLFSGTFFMIFNIMLALTPLIVIVWLIWMFVRLYHDAQFQKILNRGMFPQGKI